MHFPSANMTLLGLPMKENYKTWEKDHSLIAVSGNINHKLQRFRNSLVRVFKDGGL